MTAVDLDALDKLRGAANIVPLRQTIGDLYTDQGGRKVAVGPGGGVLDDADAALIVAAVNALPDLIAEARKYRALREAVDGLIEQLAEEAAVQKSGEYAWGMRHAIASLRAVVAIVDSEP